MWPLLWYQFCVSLPLEVRTVGLVLFLQVLTLLSVLHCLPPVGHVEPVFSDSVFSAAERRNNRELHNTEMKVFFATCAAPVPRYTQHDLLSLETAATPPPSWLHIYHILALQETCPESHANWEEEGRMNRRRSKWSLVLWLTAIRCFQLSNPLSSACWAWLLPFQFSSPPSLWRVNTPLPYHLPLHPVTVMTSQPPRSALRCVPLTDSCFTLPLVLPQPKTLSLSASSMHDPLALPGGGPTYPPSFRTTTSTSCCWQGPGSTLPVMRPRSPTWLRLSTQSSPFPALQRGPAQMAGASHTS